MSLTRRIAVFAFLAATIIPFTLIAQDGPPRGGMGMGGRGARVIGAVTAVNGTQLTVKDENGDIWTVDTTDNTRVMKERQPAKLADVTVGTAVLAMGMPEPGKKEVHAMFVSVMTPEQATAIAEAAARAKANLGKTYLAGRVIKIDELNITIKRQDGVEQTGTVDENTLLRRGGNPNVAEMMGMGGPGMGGGMGRRREGAGAPQQQGNNSGDPITMADLKVGDSVVGPGSAKGSTFLFKELHVMGSRRPQGEGMPPQGPPPQN